MNIFKSKIFVNVLFFLLVILGSISLFFQMVRNESNFRIPDFKSMQADMFINVELDEKYINDFHLYVNNYEIVPMPRIFETNPYSAYIVRNLKAKTLYFKINEENLDKIKSIVMSFDKNFYYYSNDDIKHFRKSMNGFYLFPSDIKFYKNSKYITDKGFHHRFFVDFLSIFYNSNFYIIPIILFLLAILVYQLNKDKILIRFTFVKNKAIWLFIILEIILATDCNNAPLWSDELYTAMLAGNPDLPLLKAFDDPGNPPLYFLLARYYQMMFGQTEWVVRLLSTVISCFSIYAIYYFVKTNLNKNAALLAAFLFTINTYLIIQAKEFRCYSLAILLTTLSAIYLFKIIKERKNADFLAYTFIACLMANTHYFQIPILFSNFIWGMFFLDNKARFKLFLSNVVAAISFMPYFLVKGFSQGLADKKFNPLDLVTLSDLYVVLRGFFHSKIILILSFVIAILIIFSKTRKLLFKEDKNLFNMFLFSIYSVAMLFASTYIFSAYVRPIIKAHYYFNGLCFVTIATTLLLIFPFKNKISRAVWFLFVLAFSVFKIIPADYISKDYLLAVRFEEMYNYAYYDAYRYSKQGKIVCICVPTDGTLYNISAYYAPIIRKNSVKLIPNSINYEADELDEILDKVQFGACYLVFTIDGRLKKRIETFENKYGLSMIQIDDGLLVVKMVRNR